MINFMLNVWITISTILLGIVFFGSWYYCVSEYGYFLGFGLGWIPSAMSAVLVAVLWPVAIAAADAIFFALFLFTDSRIPLLILVSTNFAAIIVFLILSYIGEKIEDRQASSFFAEHKYIRRTPVNEIYPAALERFSNKYQISIIEKIKIKIEKEMWRMQNAMKPKS